MLNYPWYTAMMLIVEAAHVVDLRLWKIAQGGADGGSELRLMVDEKVDAMFEAGVVLASGGGSDQVIDMYRRHVAANALRLAKA